MIFFTHRMTNPPEGVVDVYKSVYRLRRNLWAVNIRSQRELDSNTNADNKNVDDKNEDNSMTPVTEKINDTNENDFEKAKPEENDGKLKKNAYEVACMEAVRRCIFLLVGVAPATEGKAKSQYVLAKHCLTLIDFTVVLPKR